MNYSMMKFGSSLAICLFFASVAAAQGWRGIVPLKSTKADVERLLGKPNGLGRYQFEEERAYIDYSKGCAQGKYCVCLVPKDTVIMISVTLERDLKLSELKIDRSKYKKTRSGHLPSIVNFTNDEKGVTYTVDEDDEEVMHITYLPRTRDCQNLIYRARPSKPGSPENQTGSNQEIALPPNSWRGLVPLQSGRLDVERLLGKAKTSSGLTYVYETKNETVDVLYSAGPCKLSANGGM